jgi:hypothetical protein
MPGLVRRIMRAVTRWVGLSFPALACAGSAEQAPPPEPPPTVSIATAAPAPEPAPAPVEPLAELPRVERLDLRVYLAAGGIAVRISAGNVAPGCTALGPGIAVPKRAAGHDFATLAMCARHLRDVNPHLVSERQVLLYSDTSSTYQDVISTIDALRSDSLGSLFPDVAFAVQKGP